MKQQRIVLSGIRATGRLHFGNFIGAVQKFVSYQGGDNLGMYFIADWHTLTTEKNPNAIRNNILEVAKDYLAAGLDPNQSIIYAQSSVPELMELSWYLASEQAHKQLVMIPTLKDLLKKTDGAETGPNFAMISYPVLMAADILGPQAALVPVGEDQVPNVELARDLARKFNNRFPGIFTVPEMVQDMVRIPGLDGEKMGKSDAANAVGISDSLEEIRRKYATRGVTDEKRVAATDPGDPYNRCRSVYPVHEAISSDEVAHRTIAQRCVAGAIGCRECKGILADRLAEIIGPFQERRHTLECQNDYVRDVLHEGGKRARVMVAETVAKVREAVGIELF
jgi:tryptophanyl-tRNA synthetase